MTSNWHFSLHHWQQGRLEPERVNASVQIGDRWSVRYPIDTEPAMVARLLANVSDVMLLRFATTAELSIEDTRAEYIVICRQVDRTKTPYADQRVSENWFGVIHRDLSHPENRRISYAYHHAGWLAPTENHSRVG